MIPVFDRKDKGGKLSQHMPVLPQVAMAKFKYKKTKGNNSKIKQARVMIHSHCTLP